MTDETSTYHLRLLESGQMSCAFSYFLSPKFQPNEENSHRNKDKDMEWHGMSINVSGIFVPSNG